MDRVIDSHIHTGYVHNTFFSPEDLASLVRRAGVRALSSSLSGYNLGQRFANDETARLQELTGGQVAPLAYVCPYDPASQEDLEKRLKAGFVGIKLHPVGNLYDITVEFLAPTFELARQFGVPVVAHCAEPQPGQHNLTNPKRYEPLAEAFPDVPLVLYHFRPVEEACAVAECRPNVYLETSWHPAETVRQVVRRLGSHRVLFGTDAPFRFEGFSTVRVPQPSRTYAGLLSELRNLPLAPDEKENFLWRNSCRLFGLECSPQVSAKVIDAEPFD